MWASSSGATQDDRETCPFFFSLCVLLVERGQRTSEEKAESARRKSHEKRSKIDEKTTQIDPQIDRKSMKIRFRVVMGAQSRFGDAPGRARERSGRPKSRPGADLGVAGGGQERPKTGQNPPRAVPKTLPDDSRALPKRILCAELCRTRCRTDFSSILDGCAEAPMCRKYSSCQCFVHLERS